MRLARSSTIINFGTIFIEIFDNYIGYLLAFRYRITRRTITVQGLILFFLKL